MENTTRSAWEVETDTEWGALTDADWGIQPQEIKMEQQDATLDGNENASETLNSASVDDDTTESTPDATNTSEGEVFVHSSSTSLNNLLVYGSECSLDLDNIDNLEQFDFSFFEESGAESEDSEAAEDAPDNNDNKEQAVTRKKGKRETLDDTLRQLGELSIDDLPPVQHNHVEVKSEECDLIGTVSSTLGKLVIVETIPNKPAYDIDTLLFLDNGKRPLGHIFDVMGPVTNPLYAIRFNTEDEIAALNLNVGMSVYSAPQSEHSHYVFVQQLLKEKGSDASWKNDMEVPQELLDFSDDEAESGLGAMPDNRKRSSVERHRQFEEDMNLRNLIDSRMHRVRDNSLPKCRRPNRASRKLHGGGGGRGAGHARGGRAAPNAARAPPAHGYVHHAQPPLRPAFHSVAAASQCAYHHQAAYSLAPYSMPPPLSPFVPMFVPSIPPMQFAGPPPPHVFGGMQPSGAQQAKSAPAVAPPQAMMYPPDMGLPPVQQNPPLVPNVQYYSPQVMWGNYAAQPPPPPPAQQAVHVAAGNDSRPPKKFYRMRRK